MPMGKNIKANSSSSQRSFSSSPAPLSLPQQVPASPHLEPVFTSGSINSGLGHTGALTGVDEKKQGLCEGLHEPAAKDEKADKAEAERKALEIEQLKTTVC